MLELYSPQSAKKAIDRESDWICRVAEEFSVPASWIRAILLKEMTELNLMDLVADLAVRFYYLRFRLLGREPKSSGRFLGKKVGPDLCLRRHPRAELRRGQGDCRLHGPWLRPQSQAGRGESPGPLASLGAPEHRPSL